MDQKVISKLIDIEEDLQELMKHKTGYPGVDRYIEMALQNIKLAISNIGEVI